MTGPAVSADQQDDELVVPSTFNMSQTPAILRELATHGPLWPEENGWILCGKSQSESPVRLHLPLATPPIREEVYLEDYLLTIGDVPRRFAICLMRAGSTAAGFWVDGELMHHRVITKYVVRGRGKAQPTHLKTRGKSRYGSRLRLQKYRLWLEDTRDLLDRYTSDGGSGGPAGEPLIEGRIKDDPLIVWMSAPDRILADFYSQTPPATLLRSALRHIPTHVRTPRFKELQRIHWLLFNGRLVGDESAAASTSSGPCPKK